MDQLRSVLYPGFPQRNWLAPLRSLRLWWHLAALVTLAVLPVLGVGALAAWQAATEYRQLAEQRLQDTAQAIAQALAADIGRLLPAADLLARTAPLAGTPRDVARAQLVAEAGRLAAVLGMQVGLIEDGTPPTQLIVSRDGDTASSLPEAAERALRRSLSAQQPVLSDLAQLSPTDQKRAAIYLPMADQTAGVLAVSLTIDPTRLARILDLQGLPSGGFGTLTDGQGTIVARSPDHDGYFGLTVPTRTLDLSQGAVWIGPSIRGQHMVFATYGLPGIGGWGVTVAMPYADYEASWRTPLQLLLFGGLLALSVGVAGAILLGRGLARSLYRLVHTQIPQRRTGFVRVREFEMLHRRLQASAAALRQETNTARQGLALLRSVLDASVDPVFVCDCDGKYIIANAASEALFGRSVSAVLGRTDAELGHPDAARIAETNSTVLAAGRPLSFELRVGGPGRHERVYWTMKGPWRSPSTGKVAGIITIAHDVTGFREAEERARKAELTLQHLERRISIGAMANGIAHELSQPLNAAASYLHGARALMEVQPGRATSGLEKAGAQIQRAGEILRRLRDFLAHGEMTRHPEDVGDVVREAVELALSGSPDARPRQVTVTVADTLEPLKLDRIQVQQVVVNLVRNAVQAMQAQPEDTRQLVVTVARTAEGAEVSIADSGPGLPTEVVERLFEPFVSTRADGMGVGLSISRSIVEAHGGQVRAEPRDGGGTVFRFTLAWQGGLKTEIAA